MSRALQRSSRSMILRSLLVIGLFATAGYLSACASGDSKQGETKKPVASWITESNKIAEEYSRSWAEIYPEHGSGMGIANTTCVRLVSMRALKNAPTN